MAKFLLAGGYDEATDQSRTGLMVAFVRLLARELVMQGHVLIGGAQTPLDADAAEAANEACQQMIAKGRDDCRPEVRIRSFIDPSKAQSHDIGYVGRSSQDSWGMIGREFYIPEPIDEADAVLLVGGFEGTFQAANWARLANKPLVPVAAVSSGMAAESIFNDEKKDFDKKYSALVDRDSFIALDRVIPRDAGEDKLAKLAQDVVAIAERLVSPKDVFVIMSYSAMPEFEDVRAAFRDVCKQAQFETIWADDRNLPGHRIMEKIYRCIRQSAFVIADVTESKPNVFYELGFARGLGKSVIVTAKKDTPLPFDIYDVPVAFWKNIEDLKTQVRDSMAVIAETMGR